MRPCPSPSVGPHVGLPRPLGTRAQWDSGQGYSLHSDRVLEKRILANLNYPILSKVYVCMISTLSPTKKHILPPLQKWQSLQEQHHKSARKGDLYHPLCFFAIRLLKYFLMYIDPMVRILAYRRLLRSRNGKRRFLEWHTSTDWKACAEVVCDLERQCINLAAAVERGFDDENRECYSEEYDVDRWDFGVAVAEAIANGLAAMVTVLDPCGFGDGCADVALKCLEELGRELDCLSSHLLGGLVRARQDDTCVEGVHLFMIPRLTLVTPP